jgi:amidase
VSRDSATGSTPTASDVEALARLDGIELSTGEATELLPAIVSLISFGHVLERLAEHTSLPRDGPRDAGSVPSAVDNPYNAFIRRCSVQTCDTGPLAGKTIGVKDNIALAGIPMTNGSNLTPYDPARDAVVVERILAAGGRITGTLNMDDFGTAGFGETSAFGPPRNPVNPAYSAGGSSGGSGAAVRSGEVDLALGVDQGGSGRIPAAFCGVVAAKATHGLVPSFGVTHMDHTIDAVTPLGRSVFDVALLLEVIAGPDWRDPQWVRGEILGRPYTTAAEDDARHLRVGLVEESRDPAVCVPAVLEGMQAAADALTRAGASVEVVSIPLWRDALAIFVPYIGHLVAAMFRSEGQGVGHLGAIDIEAMEAFASRRRSESIRLGHGMKAWIIADRYVREQWLGLPFARLHNLRLAVRRQIISVLTDFDVLLTPTVPMTAPKLGTNGRSAPEVQVDVSAGRAASADLAYNTAPLNLSGHPAVSVPSGVDADGLPTAVQVIARHHDEMSAFRAAFEIERAIPVT